VQRSRRAEGPIIGILEEQAGRVHDGRDAPLARHVIGHVLRLGVEARQDGGQGGTGTLAVEGHPAEQRHTIDPGCRSRHGHRRSNRQSPFL